MRHRDCSRDREGAFTLVELLVVIAIIMVLAGMLMPLMKTGFARAEMSQAETEVKALDAAFRAYLAEYKAWPTNLSASSFDTYNYGGQPTPENEITGIQVEQGVARMLRGENVGGQNPHKIQFMDIADSRVTVAGFLDPWGQPYKYMLDYSHDGQTHTKFTGGTTETNVSRQVLVWSRGPKGDDSGGVGAGSNCPKSW